MVGDTKTKPSLVCRVFKNNGRCFFLLYSFFPVGQSIETKEEKEGYTKQESWERAETNGQRVGWKR